MMTHVHDALCVYTRYQPDLHRFNFMSSDYEAVNQFRIHLANIDNWYHLPRQKLLLDATRVHKIPLRYLFECLETLYIHHPCHHPMPQLIWAIMQPEATQLHYIARIYSHQTPYPVTIRFFPPYDDQNALIWLGYSNEL